MSNANPIESAFGFQRTAVEQTHKATTEAVEAQKTAMRTFADSLDTIEQFQAQSADLSHEAMHAYLDSIERMNPEADLTEAREMIDEQFETFSETHEESWDAVAEMIDEGVEGFEEAADTYNDVVDNTFDSFLDAHEQIEANATEVAEQVEEATPDSDDLTN